MSDRHFSSIEDDIEQTRERLAATIDQLFYRASPKTIVRREVEQVKGFFVNPSGAPRQDNIIKVAGGTVGVIAAFVLLRKILK